MLKVTFTQHITPNEKISMGRKEGKLWQATFPGDELEMFS
jgi:hypothetical protein